ncbi:hypothetical protein GCM10012287_39190 [Streptomyces daqingensis]|uniref:Aminoglycoside phosphotransferase domain-containing protein n=1 Tax=Streptomyces daqingensis TaxID=1472640 RepID=A0ABQ2MJA2_9ACTN|nr:aminoglycoside phosphotransferase family protein [Streptomyces daqingensis]GGO53174.1 hypothetical protein GCM10012287_39190 [Streptomyces daqingensis]
MGGHTIHLEPHRVTKRFRGPDGPAAARREWRALELLAGHAPGLAPAPLQAGLLPSAPVVAMSRLPGEPLRGQPLDERRLTALADAVRALHSAVPPEVLSRVPVRPGRPAELTSQVRSWASQRRAHASAEVTSAADRGLRWLDGSAFADGTAEAGEHPPEVFGAGDGNLANYLWDGARVRIVDFEESGRSDRLFELAEITEHVGSWVEYPLDADSFLRRFALTGAEHARLCEYRRLLALVWLFLLSPDEQGEARNPSGTVERQAARLVALLA